MIHERFKIDLNNCVFLYDYTYINFYEKAFQNKNLYKYSSKQAYKLIFKNIFVVLGIGGLHSFTQKVNKTSPEPYSGSSLIFSFSNEEYVTFNLDFQSFYVNIVLQILERLPSFEQEKDILKELNEIRLKLKKKKFPIPNDAIFKISTLAYTGSLNDYRSNVFFPKLYHSMTFNGQLLCLELLEYLKKYLVKIIEVNTDGVIIFFKRKDYDQILTLCDKFEEKYNFKIDTRTEIKSGFFFNCNKKVYIDDEEKVKIKGFSTGFSFNFFPNFLVNFMKKNKSFLMQFVNDEESEIELYDLLWESFKLEKQNLFLNKTINLFVKNETINKTKMLLFFSKNPDYYAGIPMKNKRILGSYPISVIDFKSKFTKTELIKFILENLDFSSYWIYILRQFASLYLYNIKNDKIKENVISLFDIETNFLKNSPDNSFNFFMENRKMLAVFEFLLNKGFIVFFKDRDKKSFIRKKMIQTNLAELKNQYKEKFSNFLFEEYNYGVVNAYSIAVHLKDSWENNLCCLDFDDIEWFFEKKHFNEKKNHQQKHFIEFLLEIKKNGFLIFSSRTNTPFDRFKVFFKLKNVPKDYPYKDFKKLTQNDIKNYNFNTEDVASIFGDGKFGQKLMIPNCFGKLIEIEFEDYKNFFINQTGNIWFKNETYENKTYEEFLVELFDERDSD